jgi:exodeoxyribonuclease X
MRDKLILVVDTETTGLDPKVDRVVEIGVVTVNFIDSSAIWSVGQGRNSLVNPGIMIPPTATAVHHILDEDVASAPDLSCALDFLKISSLSDDAIIAAHNAKFDRSMLPMLHNKRWIDTYRCAMHVWPDAPNFKNATLFYWLKCGRLEKVAHHSAAFDAELTANVLCHLLKERSIDELLVLSEKEVLLRTVGFGMHFGLLWAEVPYSYLEWVMKKDFDSDVKFTVKTEIARRKRDSG